MVISVVYNGVFRCHGNMFCYIYRCKVHNIGPINVCTNFDINRYKLDEFRKPAKTCFILCHVIQKRYVIRLSGKYIFRSGTFCNQLEVSRCFFFIFW